MGMILTDFSFQAVSKDGHRGIICIERLSILLTTWDWGVSNFEIAYKNLTDQVFGQRVVDSEAHQVNPTPDITLH